MGKTTTDKSTKTRPTRSKMEVKEPILKLPPEMRRRLSQTKNPLYYSEEMKQKLKKRIRPVDPSVNQLDDTYFHMKHYQNLFDMQQSLHNNRQTPQMKQLTKAMSNLSIYDREISKAQKVISQTAQIYRASPLDDMVQIIQTSYNDDEKGRVDAMMESLVKQNYIRGISIQDVKEFIASGYTMTNSIKRRVQNNETALWIVLVLASIITLYFANRWDCSLSWTAIGKTFWEKGYEMARDTGRSFLRNPSYAISTMGNNQVCVQNTQIARLIASIGIGLGTLGLTSASLKRFVSSSILQQFLFSLVTVGAAKCLVPTVVTSFFQTPLGSKVSGDIAAALTSVMAMFAQSSQFRTFTLSCLQVAVAISFKTMHSNLFRTKTQTEQKKENRQLHQKVNELTQINKQLEKEQNITTEELRKTIREEVHHILQQKNP